MQVNIPYMDAMGHEVEHIFLAGEMQQGWNLAQDNGVSHGAKTSVIAKKTNKGQWLLPSNIVKKPSQGCLGLQNLLHPTFLESIIHQLQRTVAMITFG